MSHNTKSLELVFKLSIVLICLASFITPHPKGDELRTKTIESENGILVFSVKSFKEYVMSHPRPYDVIVLFTMKYKCNLCEAVKEEFSQVAESSRAFGGYKPDMIKRKRALFFAILYYSEESSSIFKALRLPSTTSILYTSPQNIQIDDNGETYIKYDEDYVVGYKERSETVYAHKMLEFANAKSGRGFELKKNPLQFLFYFMIFIGMLIFGFYCFQHFKQVFMSPYLWLFCSFVVYIICIGGIVYNIINGAHFAKFDRDGYIVEIIHSGQRSQYIGEGLLLSTLFVLGGTLLYAFTWVNKIQGYWPHRIASLLLLFCIAILSKVITMLYQKKANWYNPTFMPPYGYTRGPLINDQGNSF